MPFGAGPLFGLLYRNTVATFPAAYLLVNAGLKIIQVNKKIKLKKIN